MKINKEYMQRFSVFNYHELNSYDVNRERKTHKIFLELLKEYNDAKSLKKSSADANKLLSITQKAPINVDVSYIEVPTKDDYMKVFPGRLVFKEVFLVSSALSRTFHIGFNKAIGAIHCILPMVINVLKDYLYNELTSEQFKAKYSDPK